MERQYEKSKLSKGPAKRKQRVMTELEAKIMPILDELLQMPPDMTGLVDNDAIL